MPDKTSDTAAKFASGAKKAAQFAIGAGAGAALAALSTGTPVGAPLAAMMSGFLTYYPGRMMLCKGLEENAPHQGVDLGRCSTQMTIPAVAQRLLVGAGVAMTGVTMGPVWGMAAAGGVLVAASRPLLRLRVRQHAARTKWAVEPLWLDGDFKSLVRGLFTPEVSHTPPPWVADPIDFDNIPAPDDFDNTEVDIAPDVWIPVREARAGTPPARPKHLQLPIGRDRQAGRSR